METHRTGLGPTDVVVDRAIEADARAVARVARAAADDLTARHGSGPWSRAASETAALRGIEMSTVLVARSGQGVVGSLRLTEVEPVTIDPARFTPVRAPLYVVDVAVAPQAQRRGVGSALMAAARTAATRLGADALRLDAYDDPAGAGPFYLRCDFRPVGGGVHGGVALLYFEALLGR
ncbi:MAG: GNAT family N-acetyltransferase [Gemmatimonadota bacterium]